MVPTPPNELTVAVPLEIPQSAGVPVTVVVNAGAALIVNPMVPVQPLLSVTVAKYEPGDKFVKFGEFKPDGVQEYENGATPPETRIPAVPLFNPSQVSFVV